MRSFTLLAALAVLATVACSEDAPPPQNTGGFGGSGGSGGSGGTPGPAFDPVAFCQERREASCDLLFECYPTFMKGSKEDCYRQKDPFGFGDVATAYDRCLAEATPVAYRITQGTIAWDPDAASACVEAFKAQCPTGELWQANVLSPCPLSEYTDGEVGIGDRCQTTSDCQDGLFCRIQDGDCYGACIRFAGQGEACGAGSCNSAPCAPGLACDAPLMAGGCGKCQPTTGSTLPVEGENCALRVVPSMCGDGTICKRAFVPRTPATCTPRAKLDEPCLETWECEQDLVCGDYPDGEGTGKCIEPIAIGEPCATNVFSLERPGPDLGVIFALDPCVQGAACRPDPENEGAHVCVALPERGDACVPAKASAPQDGLGCMDAVCVPSSRSEGTCERALREGDSCASWPLELWQNACEPGLTCRRLGLSATPACHADSPAGETCVLHSDCASGRCVGFKDNTTGATTKECVEADFICDL